MIVSNLQVYGLGNSIRVSKFPMQVDTSKCDYSVTERTKSLANTEKGSGHDNFLCGIIAQFDLTFSNKAWIEAERYHWFEIVSSQSTMHKINKMDFDSCFNEYVTESTKKEMERLKNEYEQNKTPENYLRLLYNCPSGILITAGISTNYQQLKTIYAQRKNHRLPEWRAFCDWIEKLPHSEFITGKE